MLFGPIKYINEPRSGGKYGSVKSGNGLTIMVPPDLIPQFTIGTTVEISTKQQTWGAGTPDERLVTIATSGPLQGHTGAVQAQGVQAGYQGANQGPANQRPNTGFQPRVIQGGPGGTNPTQPDQARHIFITGVVGRAMGSGKFTASEIPVLTQAAGEAYDRLLDRTRPPPVAPPPPEGFEVGDPGPGLQ